MTAHIKAPKIFKKIMSSTLPVQSKHNNLIFAYSHFSHSAKFWVLCYAWSGTVDGWCTQLDDADHNIKYVHTHVCGHISL